MFTGLVQRVGRVREVRRAQQGASLWIDATLGPYAPGESIAVDGACLTVDASDEDGFRANASTETLAKTTLGERRSGDGVHLERALRLGDPMGGHLVTGHVDGVGRIAERAALGDAERVVFEVPAALAPLLASKGSVAIDGVSLTVNGVSGTRFDVVLVPHTRQETTFDDRPLGAPVNVEVDVLAKYVARLLGKPGVSDEGDVSLELLRDKGFL
ncbi:MAG: riboflavin synthase [Myxococcota bacterium]